MQIAAWKSNPPGKLTYNGEEKTGSLQATLYLSVPRPLILCIYSDRLERLCPFSFSALVRNSILILALFIRILFPTKGCARDPDAPCPRKY